MHYLRAHPDWWLGWPEIARTLGRSERTLRRWKTDHGLPVRKVGQSAALNRRHLDQWIWEMDQHQRELLEGGANPRTWKRRGLAGPFK